jgi:predicted dithiol-disulfide oxidoreductase (DUF899 family)
MFSSLQIVSREEWLTARKELLDKEKAAVRANAVFKLDKEYTFESPDGKSTLSELFQGRKQLIVYHFMLGPNNKAGCPSCSFLTDNLPSSVAHLNAANTTLVLVSRAPIANIQEYKKRMGWNFPWYSSFGTDFNWDFNVSQDEAVTPVVYNASNLNLTNGYSYLTFSEDSRPIRASPLLPTFPSSPTFPFSLSSQLLYMTSIRECH